MDFSNFRQRKSLGLNWVSRWVSPKVGEGWRSEDGQILPKETRTRSCMRPGPILELDSVQVVPSCCLGSVEGITQSSQPGQGHLRSLDVYLPGYVRAGMRAGSHPAQTGREVSASRSSFSRLPCGELLTILSPFALSPSYWCPQSPRPRGSFLP